MKPKLTLIACIALLCSIFSLTAIAQSPGLIIRPAGGSGVSILNPNGDAFCYNPLTGFTSNDITQSEIPFKVVPPIMTEPTGDLSTGPSGGFTDIVKTVDNSGFYVYYDGTNIMFRLRIGNVIAGSKGYSILIDTDGKMGNSGPNADPNYIANTNTSNGNPGFEYEVVLMTNFNVTVNNVDGLSNPGFVSSYPLATHSQISVALSTDSGNPDYFYDFTVPFSAIGSPASFRLVATTVTSPSSSLQGNRSDIYGIDDALFPNVSSAWEAVTNSQPFITPGDITGSGTGPAAICTSAPTVTGPISIGSSIAVTGGWSRMDISKPGSATVTLYKNGVSVGTSAVSTGGTWSVTVPSIATGDIFYAKAQAVGESSCLQSASLTAGCTSLPAAPVLTCASSKGIVGNIPTGTTVLIYLLPTTNASAFSNPITTNITYPTSTSFAYYSSTCTGSPNVANGTYMIYTSNGGCLSAPTFECVNSGSSALTGLATNSIALTGTIFPYQTSISGTGVASGNIVRLFINGQPQATITATGTSFTFTGLSLKASDQIRIYVSTGSGCMTMSNVFTVSCYTAPPVINTSLDGKILASLTSITGSALAGATVNLYQGTAPSGTLIGSATASASGAWTIPGMTLTAGLNYYTTQTIGGCTSVASAATQALAATTACATIVGTYQDNATAIGGTLSTAFTGTVRLYADGSLIGSQSVTAALAWSIPVNTLFSNTIYTGAKLVATTQSATGAENSGCGLFSIVTCTIPNVLSLLPLNITIGAGQLANFSILNSQSGILYSLTDLAGTVYYGTSKFGNGGSLAIPTNTFNAPGTYTVVLKATSLSGPGCESTSTGLLIVSSTLPVTLTSFTGQLDQDVVKLKWTTANEMDNNYFEIQRSVDGVSFSSIGTVNAIQSGSQHTYNFTDQYPVAGKNFYRLKIVGMNGASEYSRVINIDINNDNDRSIAVYPNPVSDYVQLNIRNLSAGQYTMTLTNTNGQKVKASLVTVNSIYQVVSIVREASWTSGVYMLQLSNGNERYSTRIVLK